MMMMVVVVTMMMMMMVMVMMMMMKRVKIVMMNGFGPAFVNSLNCRTWAVMMTAHNCASSCAMSGFCASRRNEGARMRKLKWRALKASSQS